MEEWWSGLRTGLRGSKGKDFCLDLAPFFLCTTRFCIMMSMGQTRAPLNGTRPVSGQREFPKTCLQKQNKRGLIQAHKYFSELLSLKMMRETGLFKFPRLSWDVDWV